MKQRQPAQEQSVSCQECTCKTANPICKSISPLGVDAATVKNEIALKKGEGFLIKEERSSSLFIVKSGVIKLTTKIEDTESLDLLYTGNVFGGLEMLGQDGIQMLAKAPQDAIVCEVNSEGINLLLKNNPRFLNIYLMSIGLFIASLRAQKVRRSRDSVYYMLLRALYKDFKNRGYMFDKKRCVTKILDHQGWALHLGTRRESISRCFKVLAERQIIAAKPGGLVLLDEYKLLQEIFSEGKPKAS